MTKPKLYRCMDVVTLPLHPGSVLAHCPITRQSVLVPTDVARRLLLCDQFRPLSEHATRLREMLQLPVEEEASLVSLLSELANVGLLVSLSELKDKICNIATPPDSSPAVQRVCVVTNNRAAVLRRV